MTSGQSAWPNRIIVASIFFVAVVVIWQYIAPYVVSERAVLHIGSARFDAKVAATERTRKQGLSGTKDLPENQAMFFVFDSNSRWGIWMKDMNYAIDIVWLNESKKIVDIAFDAQPDSYPTKSFFPKEDARYVVELKSGVVKDKGIKIGQEMVVSGTSKQL